MMKFSQTEKILFALAVALGAFIRLLNLGALPLGDGEAQWALQSLDLSRGLRPEIGPTPVYVLLTGLVFYLASASDALARLVPALAGSLLVAAPLFFTRFISPRAAVFLAFGLAIDPGLVTLSRTAGSGVMALSFVVMAFGLWAAEKPRAAGVFAGLALLSGPALWSGALGLLVTFLIARGLGVDGFTTLPRPEAAAWRQFGIHALGAFLLAGSLVFTAPTGLGAAFAAPVAFLQGWLSPSEVPVNRLFLALPFYHILPLGFGLFGLARGIHAKDPLTMALGLWLGVSFALAVAAPGRQVTDLGWTLLPLWALAARELARLLGDFTLNGEVVGTFGLTTALLAFAWLDLASISAVLDQNTINLRLVLFFGALLLLGLSLLLVALGWSPQTARLGGVSGLLAALVVFTLAATWAAGGLRASRAPEMWHAAPSIDQSRLLVQTIEELAEWKHGVPTSLPVTVLGYDSPALDWSLRAFNVTKTAAYDTSLSAPLVISYDDPNLIFNQSYRGQDFFWRTTPAWDDASLLDWIDWLTRRKIPFTQDKIILWAAADIFPGAAPAQP